MDKATATYEPKWTAAPSNSSAPTVLLRSTGNGQAFHRALARVLVRRELIAMNISAANDTMVSTNSTFRARG